MNTAFLLMAQCGGKVIVPIEDKRRDYFFTPEFAQTFRAQAKHP